MNQKLESNLIGKLISSDQNIGIIKYVGPIYEINEFG
jgi:hypothetical protein